MLNEKCQERHNKGKDRPVSSRGLSRTPGEGFSVPLEKALNMGVVRNAATSATALHEDDSEIYYSGTSLKLCIYIFTLVLCFDIFIQFFIYFSSVE